MKRLFYIAAAAMAVLSSCTKENPIVEVGTEPESVSMPVFKATIEGPATKTTLGEGYKVNWENGDEVLMMFANENNDDGGVAVYVYEATPGVDASSATLAYKSDVLVLDSAADILMMAVYPASMASLTEGMVFPATQTYNGDGKIPFAPMVYMGDLAVTNIKFKNAASLLKITVPYAQMHSVSSITVSSNLVMNGVVIYDTSGYFYIDAEDCGPVSDENSKLTLNCGNVAIPVDGSKTFYISILPLYSECDYHVQAQCYEYLQIDVTDGNITKSMRTTKASGIQVQRNKIYPITFNENYSPAPAYEYVDLGLSVKWATFNVGATAPEEYGDYFAWGETEPKTGYDRWNYKYYYRQNYSILTKYCTVSNNGKDGFTDDKRVLDPEDDAAHVNWGGDWRMPTKSEFVQLYNNCNLTWYPVGNTEFNGVAGFKFQSLKQGFEDKWIFLPATGSYENERDLTKKDEQGFYWSSTLDGVRPWLAEGIEVSGSYVIYRTPLRYVGQCIRPVCN